MERWLIAAGSVKIDKSALVRFEPFVQPALSAIIIFQDKSRNSLLRNLMASFLIAISTLAHGFWRASDKLHHFLGAILVLAIAAIVLPVSIMRRVNGETSKHKNDEHE